MIETTNQWIPEPSKGTFISPSYFGSPKNSRLSATHLIVEAKTSGEHEAKMMTKFIGKTNKYTLPKTNIYSP